MTVKIVLPSNDGIKCGWKVKVFSSTGNEITDITSIDIRIRADEIVTATIDISVSELESMANVHAMLGTETLKDIVRLHGFELARIPTVGNQIVKNVKKG